MLGQETLVRTHIEEIAQRIQAELDAGEVVMSGDEVILLKSILGQGSSTAGQFSRIDNTGTSTVNWRQQLRRWVGQAAASTYSIQSPPRRYPHLLGIVPGRRRQPRRPCILVGIDTSGSISHGHLEDFCAELTKLSRGNDIWVAEVDFVVHDLYRYRRPPTIMTGRGGTSFMPLFEQEVLRRARPDLIVYLTDGEGAAPTTEPAVPVLWVLTPGGEKPSLWGQAIWLEDVSRC